MVMMNTYCLFHFKLILNGFLFFRWMLIFNSNFYLWHNRNRIIGVIWKIEYWLLCCCSVNCPYSMSIHCKCILQTFKCSLFFSLEISLCFLMFFPWWIELSLGIIKTLYLFWWRRTINISFSFETILLIYHLVSKIHCFSIDKG